MTCSCRGMGHMPATSHTKRGTTQDAGEGQGLPSFHASGCLTLGWWGTILCTIGCLIAPIASLCSKPHLVKAKTVSRKTTEIRPCVTCIYIQPGANSRRLEHSIVTWRSFWFPKAPWLLLDEMNKSEAEWWLGLIG